MSPTAYGKCRIADPCYDCAGILGHPPALRLYDHEAGDYADAPADVCTARWATGGVGRLEGGICGHPAVRRAGDLMLCEHHYTRMWQWFSTAAIADRANPPRPGDDRYELLKAEAAYHAEVARERLLAEQKALEDVSIVYYLQRQSDGLIKIGTTTSPWQRFASLRAQHGPLRLLATHGGTRRHESDMHVRFRKLLAEGREWFRPERALLAHVARVRRAHDVRGDGKIPVVDLAEIRAMIRNPARRVPAA